MTKRAWLAIVTIVLAGGVAFTQPGRGGSQWLTAFADAQRTSWVRTDDKVSLAAMSKPGFELQWKTELDNQPRGLNGLGQGVSAAGVTLFVPMTIVTGSSNNVYAVDNDTGYVVWQRHFDAALPAVTPQCPGGISAGATRIVRLDASATAASGGLTFGRGAAGYRSLLGEPGEGVPLEGRAAGPGRAGGDAGGGTRGAGAPPDPARGGRGAAPGGGRGAPQVDRIPGAPPVEQGGPFGMLFRPSGVGYVISSDGMLHVVGLPSGKDIQRPAPFLPANARWSAPVAAGTMLYAATVGDCGGAPSGVWAIDLDSEAKPVVSWKTEGGSIVGAVAITSDHTLIAAIGAGPTTGDGKANAIVALDPKTLTLKDWFTQPTTEFVTGPTIVEQNGKQIVASATRDGRLVLLDAASLGGANHSTPLFVSKPFLAKGATVSADALAAWQQSAATATETPSAAAPTPPQSAAGTTWILLPVSGGFASDVRTTNGPVSAGGVVALKLSGAGGSLSLEPGWVSHNQSTPGTPLIVNGVVFTLATGASKSASGRGTPAVVHAYDGATGKRLWNSGTAMTTFASPGSFWSNGGQVYVGTHDGTLHAFGFNDERRATTSQ
jgi:putative pyrroloquinoline-quinone-binding quinoprotein